MPSRPVQTVIAWKRRGEAPNQYHIAGVVQLDYINDANGALAGKQQRALIDSIGHDPADEIIDVFTIDIGPTGQQQAVNLVASPYSVTVQDVGGIDSVVTSLTVSTLGKAADWPDNAFIQIEDEVMQITAGGGTTTWTITRGIHGTTAASHAQNVEIRRVIFSVSHEEITLSGDATALGAPTLALTPLLGGFRLNITPPSDPGRVLLGYDIYRDTASPATTFFDSFPGLTGQAAEIPLLLEQGEDKSATYFFRAKAVSRSGVASAFSNEVSGQVLTAGDETPAVKPDAPTVTVVQDGGDLSSGFGFTVGVEFSSTTGAGGVTKTQLQVAESSATHSTSTGFSATKYDETGERPPVLFRPRVDQPSAATGGAYQFSARIFNVHSNAGAGEWSDWSAPVTANTGTGQADGDAPGPPEKFRIGDAPGTDGELGNSIFGRIVEPETNSNTVYAYHVQASTTLWTASLADALGVTAVEVNGTCDLTHAGQTITNVSPTLTASAHVGDILYLYSTADNSSGKVTGNQAVAITANTTTTITVAKPVALATQTGYNFAICTDWDDYDFRKTYQFLGTLAGGGIARIFGQPDREIYEIGPEAFSKAAYWRCRAYNREGWGQWIYENGATGTTTRASATQFTPTLLDAGAVKPNALTAAVQALDAQPVGHNLVFTLFASSENRRFTWASGTLYFADGSTQAINSGDSGLLTTSTSYWVYATIGSATLTITSTAANAFGVNKVIVAIAKTSGATDDRMTIIPRWGAGEFIGANEIAVGTLSAITADIGEVTAGTITGLLIRTASSGARIEMDSSTFEAIDSGGNTRVRIPTTADQIDLLTLGVLRGSLKGSGVDQVSIEGPSTSTDFTFRVNDTTYTKDLDFSPAATGGNDCFITSDLRMRIRSKGSALELSVTGGSSNWRMLQGTGTPEGAVSADIGSLFLRTDGGAGTSLYVKESGTGNTGWVAK